MVVSLVGFLVRIYLLQVRELGSALLSGFVVPLFVMATRTVKDPLACVCSEFIRLTICRWPSIDTGRSPALLQGWFIVTYAEGIYLLNLFILFLSPKIDPAMLELDPGAPAMTVATPSSHFLVAPDATPLLANPM